MTSSSTKILFLLLFLAVLCKGQDPKLMLPIGHTGAVNSAEFSPDGKKVVTASDDGTAKIWDVETGDLLLELKGHSSFVKSAKFNLDMTKIVTSSFDKTAKIWDAISGTLLYDLKGHTDFVFSAIFSPDGHKIVTASRDNNAKIWDANSGTLLFDLKGHSDFVQSAIFSPDGQYIATASYDHTAKKWDAKTGLFITNFNGHTSPVEKVNFSSNGNKLLTASRDKTAKIWDVRSGKLNVTLTGHSVYVNSAEFSPNNQRIITTSYDGIAKIWDANSGKIILELKGSPYSLNAAHFSPNGQKIVTASTDNMAKIWDANSGSLVKTLKGNSTKSKSAHFSPDGKTIVNTSSFNAMIWDANSGKLLRTLRGHPADIVSANFNSDGNKLITASLDGTAKIWDVKSAKCLFELRGHSGPIYKAIFSPDGLKAVTASHDHTAMIWDANTGTLLAKLQGHLYDVQSALFSPDGKKIVTASTDCTARIWDATTGQLLKKLLGHQYMVFMAQFCEEGRKIVTSSPDAIKIWDANKGFLITQITDVSSFILPPEISNDVQKILSAQNGGIVKLWDVKTLNFLQISIRPNTRVTSMKISPDGQRIVTGYSDGVAVLCDAKTGNLVKELIGHNSPVNYVEFSPDNSQILTSSDDNTCKVWNASTGKLIYTFLAVDSTDYFTQIPSGYYQCTPNAAKLLHYVTKDLKVITFEQLDVKYNRPDKVLAAIGNTDTALIYSYHKAWQKRIKKLGIDTTSFQDGFSAPESDIKNRNEIAYEQTNSTLKLKLSGKDSNFVLDRFNVWVNEVPVFGQRGVNIRNQNIKKLDTTLAIALSVGENRIETSVLNVNGIESYRMPLTVKYLPKDSAKEMLYFAGIGINEYEQSENNLQWSVKDIRDLSSKLKQQYGYNIHIDTLFNRDATRKNILALKKTLLKSGVNDKVILSFSGHGLLSKTYDYYLSTYSINFNKPDEGGLPYEDLEWLMDSIPARKKLMLIDACHSGEVDKDEMLAINNSIQKQGLKGVQVLSTKKPAMGMKNSFELMQNMFANVNKGTGATIISASGGTQFAQERGDLKNGVFTYSILEIMQQKETIKISELKESVGKRVEELTDGLQKPTSRNETIYNDWRVW